MSESRAPKPTRPTAPSSFRITNPTQTTLTLAWTAPSGSVSTYAFEEQRADGTWQQVGLLAYGHQNWVHRALTPNTAYIYRMRAGNAQGWGAYSATASGTTLAPPAPDTVSADRSRKIGTSRFTFGTVPVQNPFLTGAYAKDGMARWSECSRRASQHIYGFGPGNPQPSPGVYSWGGLDMRVQRMRDARQQLGITLCQWPDWMTKLGTNTSTYSDLPPTDENIPDAVELVRSIAVRYPDVRHWNVHNEMRGYWLAPPTNRWNYEGYVRLYNGCYDALKGLNTANQVYGPYVPLANFMGVQSNPTRVASLANRPYGTLDQRDLDVISYFLANAHGCDGVSFDGNAWGANDAPVPNQVEAIRTFYPEFLAWIRTLPNGGSVPVHQTEFYSGPTLKADGSDLPRRAAQGTLGLMCMVRAGYANAMYWSPQADVDLGHQGLWSRTDQPVTVLPLYEGARAIVERFGAGTDLFATTSLDPLLEVLASATHILVTNLEDKQKQVTVQGQSVALEPWGIAVVAT